MKVSVKRSLFAMSLAMTVGQDAWASKPEEQLIFVASTATKQEVPVEVEDSYDWKGFGFNKNSRAAVSVEVFHLDSSSVGSQTDKSSSNNYRELIVDKGTEKNKRGCLMSLLFACRRSAPKTVLV